MRGKIDDEDIGLKNIPGYHLAVLKLKFEPESLCDPDKLIWAFYLNNLHNSYHITSYVYQPVWDGEEWFGMFIRSCKVLKPWQLWA